eukprot:CAMPEP_0185251634 /NCGR_PEP_ID=MMETSP1359-20130426/995_1 /TAXON_ID=552665 /ORGANISM="Bigelowiella longifila, Strain CCMP242" /LENGTH=145 /DNA_ID=CAMNT_0027833605 /DNA_START=69 /DNA_END=503 /DNA_ORIENTATION=+
MEALKTQEAQNNQPQKQLTMPSKSVRVLDSMGVLKASAYFIRKLSPADFTDSKRPRRIPGLEGMKIVLVKLNFCTYMFAIPDKMLAEDLDALMKERLSEDEELKSDKELAKDMENEKILKFFYGGKQLWPPRRDFDSEDMQTLEW